MKKAKLYIVSILAIVIFIVIMLSGGFLKKPFSKNDNVLECVEILKTDILNENWENAKEDLDKLKSAWKAVEKRIQFSAERDEMNKININIARIDGALLGRDKSLILMELSEIVEHWNEL